MPEEGGRAETGDICLSVLPPRCQMPLLGFVHPLRHILPTSWRELSGVDGEAMTQGSRAAQSSSSGCVSRATLTASAGEFSSLRAPLTCSVPAIPSMHV